MQVEPTLITDIIVKREARQRSSVKDLEGLMASLKSIGLINPVTIDKGNNLITGERRLAAAKALGWTKIDAQCLEDLPPTQLRIIELEENIKRAELPWQDRIKAILKVSTLLRKERKYSVEETAEYLGISRGYLHQTILLAQALAKPENADLLQAGTQTTAYNAVQRRLERAVANEMDLIGQIDTITPPKVITPEPSAGFTLDVDVAALASEVVAGATNEPVLVADFHEWAKNYAGVRFNFLHCDFPYGVGHHKSEQGGAKTRETYEDSPDVFWELVGTLLKYHSNFLAHSCHIMFWFSMNNYTELMTKLKHSEYIGVEQMPDIVWQPHPLYWYKNDNTGILPDAKRGPRRVVETALLGTGGDHNVVKSVSNCFPYPGDKKDAQHISEKPEEMLHHFFRMLVDDNTMMLDPTCGAGSSLRAAKKLGAKRVLGIEKDPKFAERAFNSLGG